MMAAPSWLDFLIGAIVLAVVFGLLAFGFRRRD